MKPLLLKFQTMPSFRVTTILVALYISQAFSIRFIRTKVYCSKTSEDFGSYIELKTNIKESGSGQIQSADRLANLPKNRVYSGLGALIANATFSGTYLPWTMSVRVYEDDPSYDDGVCKLDISTTFFTTPIFDRCIRETKDDLIASFIVIAKIFEI